MISKKNLKEIFAERLKGLIEEKNKNFSILEKDTQIHHTTLSQYVRCKRAPQIEQLCILADYFGCTVDYLLGRTDY